MADDAITLLNYIGWTAERELHVVGVSLGGMIAQGEPLQHSVSVLVVIAEKWQRARIKNS